MRHRIFKRTLVLVVVAVLFATALSAFAEESSGAKDPSFSKKWGKYAGGFPVTGVVTDCKRLNLRYSTSLSGTDNIATTVYNGAQLTVLGLTGKFVKVEWDGKILYAYGSYVMPVESAVSPTPTPVTYTYYHYPTYYRYPSYWYPRWEPQCPWYPGEIFFGPRPDPAPPAPPVPPVPPT